MSSLDDNNTAGGSERQHYGITFAVLALAGASYALLQSAVAPALPAIQEDLHASATATAWLLTGYLLSASVLTPIVGRLGDMFGKERTLVVALVVLAIGTLLAAVANSIGMLIFGSRLTLIAGSMTSALAFALITVAHGDPADVYVSTALLGAGIGLAFASLANLIVEAVPPEQAAVATGVNTVMRTLGGAVGGQLAASACLLAGVASIAVPKPPRHRLATLTPAAAPES